MIALARPGPSVASALLALLLAQNGSALGPSVVAVSSYPSLQAAIDANPGRILQLQPVEYRLDAALRLTRDGTELHGPARLVQTNSQAALATITGAAGIRLSDLSFTRSEGAQETSQAGIDVKHARDVVLSGLRITENHTHSSIRAEDSEDVTVEHCTIVNYKGPTIDDRTAPRYEAGYAFKSIDGTGIQFLGVRGGVIRDNRIEEQRLLPTREVVARYGLGQLTAWPKAPGRLMPQDVFASHYTNNWHQGAAIQVTTPEESRRVIISDNLIEHPAQGLDIHADNVTVTNNVISHAMIGMKAMHGAKNVLISANQFLYCDLWGVLLMPGAASHESANAEAGRKGRRENVDGGSIIADNVFSGFGFGDQYWNWEKTDLGIHGARTVIAVRTGQLPENPSIHDVLVTGNLVYDTGRDTVLIDGRWTKVPPRYFYALYVDQDRAPAPVNVRASGNLLSPGLLGATNFRGTNAPADLRCEYLSAPLGIDAIAPRLSWRMDTESPGAGQSAYRVLVASSPETLAQDRGDLWDSGKVAARDSANVRYAGSALRSRQTCWWKVQLWDERGRISAFSDPARFEMGLLSPDDWQAEWLGGMPAWPGRAIYLRCPFRLEQTAKRARLYITGLGYYEAYLNGGKVGDAVLEPAVSDTSKRLFYRTYDVTAALQAGQNVLAAAVGAGWEGRHVLRAQLEIEEWSGRRVVIATVRNSDAPTWTVATGPVVSESLYGGETYDARQELPHWNEPEPVEAGPEDVAAAAASLGRWTSAFAAPAPGGRLVAAAFEPIRIVETMHPVGMTEPRPGVFVVDYGQNHAGWERVRVQGPAGTTLTLRFAETLEPDGTVSRANLRFAEATDRYILRGGGPESWEPKFTYHGYRYVQVEGWPGRPGPDALTACVIRSGVAERGKFASGDPLLNRIHRMVWWTEASNLTGVPTDCPQRNERMGWLNDLGARSEEMMYNFSVPNFLENFVADIGDTQDPRTGAITDTAPYKGGFRPADPVSVSYLLIPTLLAEHFGDRGVLERNYAGMKAWTDCLRSLARDDILRFSHWGDWAPPLEQGLKNSAGFGAKSAHTPDDLISTAFYFYDSRLVAEMAGELGRPNDQAAYAAQADRIRAAFNRTYWREAIGGYASGNQACNSIALYLDLVPADRRARVVASLVRQVEQDGYHLTTGNLCTKYLLEVLSAEGHGDVALKVARQRSYPGWGYMLENGATTLWERWALLTGVGMNSHNHPMLGSIGSWFYRWVAGLRVEGRAGAAPHFVFQPGALADVDRASAELPTLWGTAGVAWERKAGALHATVRVPWNCSATVLLPGRPPAEVTSGLHEYNLSP